MRSYGVRATQDQRLALSEKTALPGIVLRRKLCLRCINSEKATGATFPRSPLDKVQREKYLVSSPEIVRVF